MAKPIKTVTRRIGFCKIEFKKGDSVVKPELVFDHIGKLSYNKKYFPLEGGNMWDMHTIQKDKLFVTDSIKVIMGKIRKDDLPSREEKGGIYPLKLPKDSGLYEPMHFMVFPDNVAGFEYNFYGPRADSLKSYIPKKVPTLVNKVEMTPLMRRDIAERLSQIREIRLFRLKVHKDMGGYLRDLDGNLSKAFDALKQLEDKTESIEIILRSERASETGITIPFVKRLTKWLSRPEVIEGVNILKMRARDTISEKISEFDLLGEYLLSKKEVVKVDATHRTVNTADMFAAIDEAYRELKPEINEIIKKI